MPENKYTLVHKTNVAVTRPALEAAHWKCETCTETMGLRVIRYKGQVRVACTRCRLQIGECHEEMPPIRYKETG